MTTLQEFAELLNKQGGWKPENLQTIKDNNWVDLTHIPGEICSNEEAKIILDSNKEFKVVSLLGGSAGFPFEGQVQTK